MPCPVGSLIPPRSRKPYRSPMNYLRPIKNTSKPIALSDSHKNALATAMRQASEDARHCEAVRFTARKPAADSRPIGSEELLFIL